MRSIIVGAGPTGLYTAVALARRGHQVTVIDRDPGPADSQSWDRKGVMQFHHPHFFRQQVVDALVAEMPEVCQGLLATGWRPPVPPGPTRDELASLVTTAASSRSYPAEDTATPRHGSEHATARCPRNTRVTCLAARAQLPMSEPSSRSAAYATSRAWASPP